MEGRRNSGFAEKEGGRNKDIIVETRHALSLQMYY
jgi:hypothetical protein